MNKLVLLLFTFFIIKISFCQMPIDETTGDIQYKEVVQISDINDSTAYNRAKKWMLSNLKTSDQMTETSNDSELRLVGAINILLDTSIILGKGINKLFFSNNITNSKIIIEFKDNRYRYTIENFSFSCNVTGGGGTGKLISDLQYINVFENDKKKFNELEKELNQTIKVLIHKDINQSTN